MLQSAYFKCDISFSTYNMVSFVTYPLILFIIMQLVLFHACLKNGVYRGVDICYFIELYWILFLWDKVYPVQFKVTLIGDNVWLLTWGLAFKKKKSILFCMFISIFCFLYLTILYAFLSTLLYLFPTSHQVSSLRLRNRQ